MGVQGDDPLKPADGGAKGEPAAKPKPRDQVDEADEESFPASDPPESYQVD